MSPYQISGSGEWIIVSTGVLNDPILALGKTASHDFMCSLSPLYVLSDGTVAPLVTCVIKPVYGMIKEGAKTVGQPLEKIKVASIPNGILLTQNPNYCLKYPGLFYPGKDDKNKDKRKLRARVDFSILKRIHDWRVKVIGV